MDSIILGFACTLLGAAIGIAGSYLAGMKLARYHAKALAGQRLRDAFAPEVIKLKHLIGEEPSNDFPDFLEASFDKHFMAVHEFAFFLSKQEAPCFTKAWQKYCTSNDKNKIDFDQYLGTPEEAMYRIHDILQFTKK